MITIIRPREIQERERVKYMVNKALNVMWSIVTGMGLMLLGAVSAYCLLNWK